MPSIVGTMVRRFTGTAALCALALAMAGPAPLAAQDDSSISQSFRSDSKLAAGALASLQSGSPKVVEASNADRVSQLVGVVSERSLIELSDGKSEVHVVTSGVTQTLVSDINGPVTTGDKITASPIDGVGMKATEAVLVVGTAQADLADVKTIDHTLTARDGTERTVKIGRIPVHVHVTFHAATAVQQDFLPPFLQDFANSIAGKPVSPVRIIASMLVMVLAIISVSILLYSSVRASIISIGRNPLSEASIHKSLIEVGITIIGVLLLTFITIYLILVT